MENELTEISKILLSCEETGLAPKYTWQDNTYKIEKGGFLKEKPVVTEPVNYSSKDEEIFIVSDLHIATGRNRAGVYKGTENFFADDSFKRFLDFANNSKKTNKAILIINGDVLDFLRVVEYPGKVRTIRLAKRIKQWLKGDPIIPPKKLTQESVDKEFNEWSEILASLGISKSIDELKNSISKKEKTFGLKTNDYKSVWKFNLIKRGHPAFFESLAKWLESGNKLLIIKGNHDVEWYWLGVRNFFRYLLAEDIALRNKQDIIKILKEIILPNITFADDSVVVDNDFYIEHGHRYDKFTTILEKPYLEKNHDELNIPFGSFFNRYLLNRVELYYPYLDKVRPAGNVLPILLRNNFPLAIKILFHHVPYTIRILLTGNFKYIKFVFNRLIWFALVIAIPLALLIYFNIDQLWLLYKRLFLTPSPAETLISYIINNFLVTNLKNAGGLFLTYILSRVVGWFQLAEPDTLYNQAKNRVKNTGYRISTMGHTHNPGEYILENNKRFYNTGTWIPVIETSTAEVREDKTFTFLHLVRDDKSKLQPDNNGLLLRWNDDAGRADIQILLERK